MRILAVATNPIEGASTRYRVLAYAPVLARHGHTLTLHPFFPSEALPTIYSRGRAAGKLAWVVRGALERAARLGAGDFDLLLVHREIFPLSWPVFLSRLRRRTFRVVYDYDDALFLPQRGERRLLRLLERPDGARRLMALADAVVAGNGYLLGYARRHNPRVALVPTSIDTARVPAGGNGSGLGRCVIGWIGSHTTEKYLHGLRPVFQALARTASFAVKVVGANERLVLDGVEVIHRPWQLAREAEEFETCDIGVYPLLDEEWAKGKCGFKAIQFMAAGVPVVAAPIGVNREIIEDGVNGFLASDPAEWCDKLGRLIDDPLLRRKIGMVGRETVEQRYSLAVNAPKLLDVLERA